MAKNDIVLLDSIIDQRVSESLPSQKTDEVFEYLAFEQLLKDYDLSREELESGWVDGRDDGGVDGFFTVVNGHLLRDPMTFTWPKRNATIELVIVTAKHHSTFAQAPLDALLATLPELLDLGTEKADLKGQYSDVLLKARSLFQSAYRRLAAVSPTVAFRIIYASRGDSAVVGEAVSARSSQIVALVESMFSSTLATFEFVGAAQLVSLYRKIKNFSLTLPFVEYLSHSSGGYILVARLAEYCAFVTDDDGHLRRYLFDSNVRDYLGENRVNEDINHSLIDADGPEFWWLNNGITILATNATVLGKSIHLQDVQIVNGLQTTESVFSHFHSVSRKISADKALLVKVIVSINVAVRDQIIRATNNQSLVAPQALHATDKIQRDIEDILERFDWYYERRQNYYRNIGKQPARFVTPLYIAAGYVALVLRHPKKAARLRARFMKVPEAYAAIFPEDVPLEVWPAITEILKRCEATLESIRTSGPPGERFLARSRNLLALLAVGRYFKNFSYSIDDLVKLDKTQLSHDFLLDTWEFVNRVRSQRGIKFDQMPAADTIVIDAASAWQIQGVQQIGKRYLPPLNVKGTMRLSDKAKERIDDAILDSVDRILPSQPWHRGVHLEVAARLELDPRVVSVAIQKLIASGRRRRQENGMIYDVDGQVLPRSSQEGELPRAQSE